jgi:hypothetical protein
MVFGTFCNNFILSHVILVFLKHSNYRVFFYVIEEEIMQTGKAKHLEYLRRFGKSMNKDSRSI